MVVLAVEETWSLARMPGAWPSAWRRASDPTGETNSPGLIEDESLDQQLVRRRGAEGEEVVVGQVRMRFAAGQRTAEGHVAFCPPFSRRPEVEFEATSGPAARIELGQVLPLGAQVRCKAPPSGDASRERGGSLHGSNAREGCRQPVR